MKNKIILFFLLMTLYNPLVVKSSGLDDELMLSKKYTYKTLSVYEKQLLDDFIKEDFPAGTKIQNALTDQTSLRSKTRLAQALLLRNLNDDNENAVAVIQWILKHQDQDEKSENYGVWRSQVSSDKFDQNWREFIGCDLIIIYHNYKSRLPAEVQKGIETGLIHAARGAMRRNVSADYTNIAIMSAFLMDYAGAKFGMAEIGKAGLKKANDVVMRYNRHKTFSEFNSPTYYGVTLVALAMWRELAVSHEIKRMGKVLEKELWAEIAAFYNPNLMNMPAPYFRGYGMDMRKYYSITGLWIAVALNRKELSPLPDKHGPKFGELSNISPILHLGLEIPKSELVHLTRFVSSRFLERTVPNYYTGDTIKHVTAMINQDWMMGGLWGNRRSWNQIRTGAIHWKTKDSDISWILVPGDGNTNVRVSKTEMKVYLADPDAKSIRFFIYSKGATTDSYKDKTWDLPGMKLKVSTTLKMTKAIPDSEAFQNDQAISDSIPVVVEIKYDVPASWDTNIPLVTFLPEKK